MMLDAKPWVVGSNPTGCACWLVWSYRFLEPIRYEDKKASGLITRVPKNAVTIRQRRWFESITSSCEHVQSMGF